MLPFTYFITLTNVSELISYNIFENNLKMV